MKEESPVEVREEIQRAMSKKELLKKLFEEIWKDLAKSLK